MSASLAIAAVSPEDRPEALRLLFSRFEPPQAEEYVRLYLEAFDGAMDPAGLLEARRAGQRVGAAFFQIETGRTAMIWPPRLVANEPRETAVQLIETVARRLNQAEVRLANALLEADSPDAELLQTAGFRQFARLLYLVASEEAFPQQQPETAVELETYSAQNHDRMAATIEATYQGSLDCPAMDGLRPLDEVLAGYRGVGVYSPDRWFLVRVEGADAGCLLLADHPREESWELVYMGVVGRFRGRGLGRQIVRWAQWLAGRAGRRRLVLAVDAANAPAVAMYQSTGMIVWDLRDCFSRTI